MEEMKLSMKNINIPKGFILFISGVPGVGKTTISYELLKQFQDFRIIEETDILRDALRGYNDMLVEKFGQAYKYSLSEVEIFDNKKLLSLNEAKQQCTIMKKSIENIIARQQRKGISSIINGVHIVPEVLMDLSTNSRILFVNLYINNKEVLCDRLTKRDPESYMLQHIPFIFQSNNDLFLSTQKMSQLSNNSFYNLDVTSSSINETISQIINCINTKIQNNSNER